MNNDDHWRDQANWLQERLDVSEARADELEAEVERLKADTLEDNTELTRASAEGVI